MTEVKGSFKRLKLIDVPGAQHILEQIPPENWHESVEKGGLDLGGPNGWFKIHIGLFASGYPKYRGGPIMSAISDMLGSKYGCNHCFNRV